MMDMLMPLFVLFISIVLHEYAHGFVAHLYGDPTAKLAGRLTLNPLAHVDPLGSVLLPLLCIVSGTSFFIGWAKPVPVNMLYFRRPYHDMMWVALAGPLTNFSLAAIASVTVRFVVDYPILHYVILINLVLAVFNLLPIPPLDGSRILAWTLPTRGREFLHKIEPYGLIIVFFLAYIGVISRFLQWVLPTFLQFFLFEGIG